MIYIILMVVFAAVFLLIFGINLLLADISDSQRRQLQERMLEEMRLQQMERARAAVQYRELYELAAEDTSYVMNRKPLRERMGILLEQAGVRTKPIHLIIVGIGLAIGMGGLIGLVTGSIILAILAAPLAGLLPLMWVNMQRSSRLRKLQSQLPDAFELMSRTMRAGQTMSQALQAVADEAGAPLSEEFGYCYDQQNLGMSPEAAMRDLSRRTGLLEIKIFVLAVMVHRQTGGNLAELLEKLSFVIRERYRISGMIKALTAEGKLQAYVLLGLPVLLLFALFIVNRSYVSELFDVPIVLVITGGFMALGAVWMNRIINFDY